MSEQKIVKEQAETEFENFIVAMDIDVDPASMDADDLSGFNKQKGKIIRAIQRGDLVFNENGEAILTPSNERSKNKEPITFHERTGASLLAMDGKKKNHDVSKMFAIMGEMCKVHPSVFANMCGADIKVCESLFALLMD